VGDMMTDKMKVDSASGATQDASATKGFARKSLILIIGAVLLFFVVAGAATFFVLDFLETRAQQALDEIEVIVEQPAETSPTPVPEEIVEPAAIPSSELFTFRDIFKPVIRPSAAVTPGAVATGTAGVDRLTLVNIVVEDGVPNVVVDLNGVTHTLAAGESIAGTPWMVRSIADRSATFAYGDASIRLAVGVGAVVDPNEPGVITPVGK